MKQLMPLYGGAASVSVLASTAKAFPFSALVMNILLPFRTYSSPSRTAVVLMFCTSLPASASVSPSPPRTSPRAMRRQQALLLPGGAVISDDRRGIRWWVPITPLTLIQPRLSSSNMIARVAWSRPRPPYSSGIVMPKRPISRIVSTSSAG